MAAIEETLERGESLKATRRKLAIGRERMYALRDEQGNVTHNMEEIIKIAEQFCNRLYASDAGVRRSTEPTSVACDIQPVTKEEVETTLKGMKKGKAADDDGIIIDLLKEGGDIIL